MKPSLRNLLITGVLVVIAAGAGAWLCARYVVSHHAARPSLHEMVHDRLDLTPQQERRLAAIEGRYAADRGRLEGEIRAVRRVELAPTARVNGRIQAPRMRVHEGAWFEGTCQVGPPPGPTPATPSAPA